MFDGVVRVVLDVLLPTFNIIVLGDATDSSIINGNGVVGRRFPGRRVGKRGGRAGGGVAVAAASASAA